MDSALTIVVVEDHDALRNITVDTLRAQGHRVTGVDCAEALDDEAGNHPIDLLIIDVNLPDENGLSLAQRMRAAQPEIGIIMLTARSAEADRVAGYRHGADIYLIKPVSAEELGAAISALSRRIIAPPPQSQDRTFALSTGRLELSGPDGACSVTASDAAVLAGLSRAAGRRLETWQLLELTGKGDSDGGKAALEVMIVRLRKKLRSVGAPDGAVKAIRQIGYQLCIDIRISR